jgi:hypothetical protein
MSDMAVIVPSRGRPENIARLLKALGETKADVDLIVGVDADDLKIDDYYALVNGADFTLAVSPERRRFGPTLNALALRFADEYDYLAWMGDDHLPITEGWDKRYREELDRMGAGIVYGNDLVQGENIPTQMGFTPNIVKALGFAVPEGFIHLYIDNYFLELGRAIGGVSYLPDVIVRHLHPCAGAAQEDQTYREANSTENWSNDNWRFQKYMLDEIQVDAEKIKQYVSR